MCCALLFPQVEGMGVIYPGVFSHKGESPMDADGLAVVLVSGTDAGMV